jgi:hypothetical protein
MADPLTIGEKKETATPHLPPFLQREETAAQIVALRQAKFRPVIYLQRHAA